PHARAHALDRRLPEGARGDAVRARQGQAQDAPLRGFLHAHPLGGDVLEHEHRAVFRVNAGLSRRSWDKGATMMGMFQLDHEEYRRYKDEVLQLTNSFQRIDRRGLSDAEIATKLGLEERVVTEIRCVAERDCYSLDEWEKAIEFKDRRAAS